MATDLYKRVVFSDGEGVVHTDFNNGQDFILSRLHDALIERTAPTVNYGTELVVPLEDPDSQARSDRSVRANVGGSLAFLHDGSAGQLYQHPSVASQLNVSPGVIFQKVGAKDGLGPTFLSYEIRDGDFNGIAVPAGDATNPRWDVVQVKLELVDGGSEQRDFEDAVTRQVTSQVVNKTRRVQCTCSLKSGTPAASPVMPTPDAGYVLLGAVRVPATWTASFDESLDLDYTDPSAVIHHLGLPLGVESYDVLPHEFDYGFAANWARSGGLANASGLASNLTVWCPGPRNRRIIGVSVVGVWPSSGTVRLASAVPIDIFGYAFQDLKSLTAKQVTTGGGSYTGYSGLHDLCDTELNSSTTVFAGKGYWSNGTYVAAPRDLRAFNSLTFPNGTVGQVGRRMCLRIDGSNLSAVWAVRWYLAGGR